MADYHVLQMVPKGDLARVAYHIPVPSETNFAGKTLSECVVEASTEPLVSVVPGITSIEADAILNGTVYECVEAVTFSANLANAEKKAIIEEKYSMLASAMQNYIREVFRFWGYSGNLTG